MTCMKQEFCIHEKYCQRHIGQNFDSCILFSRNSKPMTNEEWFCKLSTDKKAKWLADNFGFVAYKASSGKPKRVQEDLVEYWQQWLKQPHTTIKE